LIEEGLTGLFAVIEILK